MRRVFAASLLALTAAAAATALAQQAPPLTDSERVVITGMVPIPDVGEGAPRFTSRDLGQMKDDARKTMNDARSDTRRCSGNPLMKPFDRRLAPSLASLVAQEFEAAQKVAAMADRAAKTTAEAETARRGAAAGKVDMSVVEARELDRQAAVRELQEARAELLEAQAMIGDAQDILLNQRTPDWLDLEMRAMRRQKEGVGLDIAMPEEHKGLDIQNVEARQLKDKKGKDIVIVRGQILNTNKKSVTVPDLFVALVDEKGWTLTNSTVSPPGTKKSIKAGKAQAFAVEVRPAPDLLKTAVVTFAPKNSVEPRMGVSYFCGPAMAMMNSPF